jgi:hypothetical protein
MMMRLKKFLHQYNVNIIDFSLSNENIFVFFLILAPYSSNVFQQQPQHFHPEHATQSPPTTIPPGISHRADFWGK